MASDPEGHTGPPYAVAKTLLGSWAGRLLIGTYTLLVTYFCLSYAGDYWSKPARSVESFVADS
jgi:hypothetical protein